MVGSEPQRRLELVCLESSTDPEENPHGHSFSELTAVLHLRRFPAAYIYNVRFALTALSLLPLSSSPTQGIPVFFPAPRGLR